MSDANNFSALFRRRDRTDASLEQRCRDVLGAGRSVADTHGKTTWIDDDPAVLLHLATASPKLDLALETELFHLFVAAGANANAVIVDFTGDQRSALQTAAGYERFELTRLLLAEGANVNVWLEYYINVHGTNAMMWARSIQMVHLLLGAGASPGDVPHKLCADAFTIEALTAIADGGWQRRCQAVRWWFFIHT